MPGTVGTPRHRILAAEAESDVARIAERPQAVLDLATTPRERRDRNLLGPRDPVGENAFAADLLVRHGAAESTRLHRPVDRPVAPARPVAGPPDRRRPAFEAQTMRLADHGIARHPAELSGNLTGSQPLRPQTPTQRDPFSSPRTLRLPV